MKKSISKILEREGNEKNPFPQFGNGNQRLSFPRMKASDSLSRIIGMDFFIPFPFPNFGNAFFSFPSRSRIKGMGFFSIPFPFPNFGNGIIHSRSRYRTPKRHSRSPLLRFYHDHDKSKLSPKMHRYPLALETFMLWLTFFHGKNHTLSYLSIR